MPSYSKMINLGGKVVEKMVEKVVEGVCRTFLEFGPPSGGVPRWVIFHAYLVPTSVEEAL